jgi:hypothetical protein
MHMVKWSFTGIRAKSRRRDESFTWVVKSIEGYLLLPGRIHTGEWLVNVYFIVILFPEREGTRKYEIWT